MSVRCRSCLRAALLCVVALPVLSHARDRIPLDPPASERTIESCEDLSGRAQRRCRRDARRHADEEIGQIESMLRDLLLPATLSLASSDEPRDLAVAAVLRARLLSDLGGREDPRVDEWRRRALSASGSDAVVAVLVRYSARTDGGDVIAEEALHRWRERDPRNLAPRMLGFEDTPAWWAGVRDADRSHAYFGEIRGLLLRAIQARSDGFDGRPESIREAAQAYAMSLAMAVVLVDIPAYPALMAACRPPLRDASPEHAADCRQIGRIMAEASDLEIAESIGQALLIHDSDTAVRTSAEERRRVARWQHARWGALSDADPRSVLAFLVAHPELGEGQSMREWLTARGEPLLPPDGWSPRVAAPSP